MESDNFDNKIRGLMKDSEMHYAPQASKAYDRIWDVLDKGEAKPTVQWPYWMAAAAVVLLLLVPSIFIVTNNTKETELLALKQEVQQLHFLAEQKNQELQNNNEQIIAMAGQQLEYENKINLLTTTGHDKERVLRDTIYIIRTKEIVKVMEKPIAYEQPQILSIPRPLEVPKIIIDDQEITKQQFVFADKSQEKSKKDKKPTIKFRLGNGGGATDTFSQSRPLAITKNLN